MFEIAQLPSNNGTFFKPDEYVSAVALLIEPKRLEEQRPGSKYGPKDTIHADITVFATQADLDAGKPTDVLKGAMIQQTYLVQDIVELVGKATVSTPIKKTFKSGSTGWVWQGVTAEIIGKVGQYGAARNAAVEADMDDAPSFD